MGESDGYGGLKIGPLPLEVFVFGHVDHNVKVAEWPTTNAGFALAPDTQARTGFDARRYLDLKRFFLFDAAAAVAFFARGLDYSSLAAAVRTGPHHAEKALFILRLAASAAGDASFGMSSLFSSRTVTSFAVLETRDAKFFVLAGCGVFERNFQVVTQIGTALDSRPTSGTLTEHIAKTEKIEYILEIGKSWVEAGRACAYALMSEAVVSSPFLGVGKYRVGFGRLFESLFGVLIARVFVRVVLDRKGAVCPLYLNISRSSCDT